MNRGIRAVVTGGAGAIGSAVVEGLLRRDIEVVLIARDMGKAGQVRDAMGRSVGRKPLIERCDLSCKSDIFDLAKRIAAPLHILINNAAECPRRRRETKEGIERQFATNVLGYFWMMSAFAPHLEAGAPSRIVNVASYWAGGLDLSDLEFKRRSYDNDAAYRQSKQADRMLTSVFAGLYVDRRIVVNTCHPGDVQSKLSSDLGFGGHESKEEGAATPLMLAVDDIGAQGTGRYFAHLRQENCHFMSDANSCLRLYEICGKY